MDATASNGSNQHCRISEAHLGLIAPHSTRFCSAHQGSLLGEITLRTRRELVAAHFLISPILEIADCQDLQEWIGPDKLVAGGPTSDVSGGHE